MLTLNDVGNIAVQIEHNGEKPIVGPLTGLTRICN